MPMTVEQDLDLLITTQSQLGEQKWTDDVSTLVKYVFVANIFKKERVTFQGGKNILIRVAVTPSTSFSMTGVIGPTDNVNVIDHLTTGTVPWRRANSNWGMDAAEMSMCTGVREIVNLQKVRRSMCFIGVAEGLETQGWSQPTDSNDALNSYGIPTWIVPNQTAAGALG